MSGEIPELGRFAEPSLYILLSLSDGPKHGYAIMTDVEAISGSPLGPGTLYAALARLEARGLIEALAAAGSAATLPTHGRRGDDAARPARADARVRPDRAGAARGGTGMTSLMRLYPRDWRERYEDEFLSLLAERPPDVRDRLDIVRGAIDARVRPQVRRGAGDPIHGWHSRASVPSRVLGVTRRARCRPLASAPVVVFAERAGRRRRIRVLPGWCGRPPVRVVAVRPARRRADPGRTEAAARLRRRRARCAAAAVVRRVVGHDAVGLPPAVRHPRSATRPGWSRATYRRSRHARRHAHHRRARDHVDASRRAACWGSAPRSIRTLLRPTSLFWIAMSSLWLAVGHALIVGDRSAVAVRSVEAD